MSAPHICKSCHRRLLLLRPRNPPQWHQRANFISLAKPGPRTTRDETEKNDILGLGDDTRERKGRYASPPEQKRRKPPRTGKPTPGDELESMFTGIAGSTVSEHEPALRVITSLDPYKITETLQGMMKRLSPPADSFRYFVEHFGPNSKFHSSSSKSSPPAYVRDTARRLMRTIITVKSRAPSSTSLPSATEVSSVYMQLGLLEPGNWYELVVPIIKNLISLVETPSSDTALEQDLFLDLLGAWNVICRDPANLQDMPEDSRAELNWSHIPPLSSHDALKLYQRSSFYLFGMLAPMFPLKSLAKLPPLALSTFQLLNSKPEIIQDLPGNAIRLVSIMARIIQVPDLDIGKQEFLGNDMVISRFITNHLPTTKSLASQITEPDLEENTTRSFKHLQLGFNKGIAFVNKRLHEAFRTKNRRQVDELWSDVAQWPVSQISLTDAPQKGELSLELGNYFILVYMGLGTPEHAIKVWNHMIQHNLQPSLATWDSMMSGCKSARDPVALEGVWRQMQNAEVQPDIVCWTTRISGLMHCRKVEAAIQALDEMGRKWLEAAKKEFPRVSATDLPKLDGVKGAVKPTIATVNAAMVGAFRNQKKEYAQQILAWAGNYGIVPDVHTYNILLNPLLRAGETEQAMAVLHAMRAAGVEADISTYTTILDETFRYASHLSPEEQKEMVFGIFDEMEEAGLKANLHTYGKILSSLLHSESEDMTVINIVLERMAKLGIEPSPHIYTDLVQYYFSRDPPQLDAARNTIERASMVIGGVDNVFWDRVIEGYSRAGETAAALKIARKVRGTGGSVSWSALKELLNALARNQEWDMAKALVAGQVVDTGGPLSADVKGKEGQHAFWRMAGELNLLDDLA